MGEVYLAASRRGRPVAVKVIRAALAADPDFRRRFRDEVTLAKAVSGTYTAPLLDAEPDAERPWLATAYVPGPSLDAAVGVHGLMPEPTLRLLGASLAEALADVHGANIVHRDLKPSNVLLTRERPKVIDFGISRAADASRSTTDGQPIGSPGYMSPEQVAGAPITAATDIFSLGAVLVYAATGIPPFGLGGADAVNYRAAHEAPRLDGVPLALLEIISSCLEKDPVERPSTEELRARLGPGATPGWLGSVEFQVLQDQHSVHSEIRRAMLGRRMMLTGAAVLATAAVGAGAAILLGREEGATSRAVPELTWTKELPERGMHLGGLLRTTLLFATDSTFACLDRTSGRLLWHDTNAHVGRPLPAGEDVYVMRPDGKVHAYGARTGRQRWTAAPAGADAVELSGATDSLLMTISRGHCQATDTASGTVRWRTPDMGVGATVGATEEGHVIVWGEAAQTSTFALLARHFLLDKDTGDVVWSTDLVCLSAPARNGLCYGLDGDMRLLALNPGNGRVRWSRATQLQPTFSSYLLYTSSSLTLVGDTLFCYPSTGTAGATSGVLAAFDAETGATRWSIQTKIHMNRGYAPSGSVVCHLDNKKLHGLDIKTGGTRWTAGSGLAGLQLLGATGGLVLCGAKEGLYAFDATTGEQVWRHAVSGSDGAWSGAVAGNVLYAVTSGTLFCVTLRAPGQAPSPQ
jgi:outer membrane protein assembly factor BamB